MLCAAICCLILFPLPNPMGGAPLNVLLIQAIPLPLALLLCTLPVIIHHAIYLCALTERDEVRLENRRRARLQLTGRVVFRARFKSHKQGSSWNIVNLNKFPWRDTKVLIERVDRGELICEKHQFDEVPAGKTLRVDSELQDLDFSSWRIMVLTREGSHVDFPDRGFQVSNEEEQGGSSDPLKQVSEPLAISR